MPALETLSVHYKLAHFPPSVGIERVYMKYLKHLEIRGASLSTTIDCLLDYLTFPKGNINTLSLGFTVPPMTTLSDPPTITAIQRLVRAEDKATGSGTILALQLYPSPSVRCSKYTEPHIPGSGWPPQEPSATLELGPDSLRLLRAESECFSIAVLQSLRLDQLRSLEISGNWSADVWTLLGNLPFIEHLSSLLSGSSKQATALNALRRVEQPAFGTQSTPAFRSLTSLTILLWDLNYVMDTRSPADPQIIAEGLADCIRLRTIAKLPLERLKIMFCDGVKENLSLLEGLVGVVEWDGFEET
ncbi:hypothetical protein H0H92_010063 [Tricholoma furcatifolium]|nr:hypothetical protein H0H92_010063 [Tricholoma furcatifolium]